MSIDETLPMAALPNDGYLARRLNTDPTGYYPDRPDIRRHRAYGHERHPIRLMVMGLALLILAAVGAWTTTAPPAAAAEPPPGPCQR